MDKFEMELYTHICSIGDELEACFIDDDCYSRVPSAREWRSASKLVHQLVLACAELLGYANATKQYNVVSIRERLHVVPSSQIEQQKKLILTEVNNMLVELNVCYKARERADGLFEIRPTIGGVRRSFYGHTAEEIAKKYKEFLNESTKKVLPKVTTLFAWFDEWCEVYKKPNVKENSYWNIVRCIKKHIKPNLKDKPLNRYNLTELTQALNAIASTRMRKYARGILQSAFSQAVVAGKISSSPAQNLAPVKHISQNGKAIALLELNAMIEHAATNLPREALLYYLFCLFAGTRRDEGLNLRHKDCDYENKIIYIHGTKTVGSNRRIPMFPILEKIVSATVYNKSGKIFNIKKYLADDYFRIFRHNHPEAVQHWLRHTFGTIQICALGIPANTVALWLGHADASTTVDIYTHPEDLAPDIYFSGIYSEQEKLEILNKRYNNIISTVEQLL